MKYQSNAQWPEGQYPFGNDVSTDQHRNIEIAEAVCKGLAKDGWGGQRKIFPVKVWVTPVISQSEKLRNIPCDDEHI